MDEESGVIIRGGQRWYPVIHIGTFSFYTFGLAFGTAICLGWVAFDQYFKRHNIHVNMPLLGICLILSGWLGAKLDSTLVTAIHLHLSSGLVRFTLKGSKRWLHLPWLLTCGIARGRCLCEGKIEFRFW